MSNGKVNVICRVSSVGQAVKSRCQGRRRLIHAAWVFTDTALLMQLLGNNSSPMSSEDIKTKLIRTLIFVHLSYSDLAITPCSILRRTPNTLTLATAPFSCSNLNGTHNKQFKKSRITVVEYLTLLFLCIRYPFKFRITRTPIPNVLSSV